MALAWDEHDVADLSRNVKRRGKAVLKKARFRFEHVPSKSNIFCDGPWSPIQLALVCADAIREGVTTHQNDNGRPVGKGERPKR